MQHAIRTRSVETRAIPHTHSEKERSEGLRPIEEAADPKKEAFSTGIFVIGLSGKKINLKPIPQR